MLAGLAAILIASVAPEASAMQRCICAPKLEVTEARSKAEVVFLGKTFAEDAQGSMERGESNHQFHVLRIWKGEIDPDEPIHVHTNSNPSACGRTFVSNQTYLVYARRVGEHLVDDGCSRSVLLSEAAADLHHLGTPTWKADADDNKQQPAATGAGRHDSHEANAKSEASAGEPAREPDEAMPIDPPPVRSGLRCSATENLPESGTCIIGCFLVLIGRRRSASRRHLLPRILIRNNHK